MKTKRLYLCLFLFCQSLLPGISKAEGLYLGLNPGETEVMHFELVTFLPAFSKADNELLIHITDQDEPRLVATQTIDMKEQNTRIVTVEKYYAATLELIESKTLLLLPPEAAEKLGIESIDITGRVENGDLVIISNYAKIPPARLRLEPDLFTGIGSMLHARQRDYRLDETYRYRQVNMVNIGGEPFAAVDVVDSVVSIDDFVATPLGEYECFKVMKAIQDIAAFTYYTRDNGIPVLVEAFSSKTGERNMNITINGYFRK